METPLLEIRDVKKYFPVKKVHGKEITVKAVDSINLKINQGEIVGLVGESGCGKSTLGKSILKLHEITGGQILFHGEDITNYNERQMRPLREKIQIIFQDPYASLNSIKIFIKKDHHFHKFLCENSSLFLNGQCSPFVSYTYRENRSPFMI